MGSELFKASPLPSQNLQCKKGHCFQCPTNTKLGGSISKVKR